MVRVEHREVWIHPTVGTEPRRIKLLLSRREITSLERAIQEGYRILPDLAFIDPRGWLKIRLVTAKPKKKYDKREALKEKDRRKHGE
jgi:SsrA-binding protein